MSVRDLQGGNYRADVDVNTIEQEAAIKFRSNDGFWCLENSVGAEFTNAVDALIAAREERK